VAKFFLEVFTLEKSRCERKKKKIGKKRKIKSSFFFSARYSLFSPDKQVIRAGQRSAVFSGLKLAKIGPIKAEIQCPTSRTLSDQFYIRFFAEDTYVDSNRFQIVSSCSQMPNQVRSQLRPNKRMKKNPPMAASAPTPAPASAQPPPATLFGPQLPRTALPSQPQPSLIEVKHPAQPEFPDGSSSSAWGDTSLAQSVRTELELAIQSADVSRAADAAARLAKMTKGK
jgi:hypothetical protein